MISISHQTDTGRKRDHNEDFYDFDESLGIYVVCDGMGGHASGEVASEMVCKAIIRVLSEKKKIIQSLTDPSDSPKRRRIVEFIKDAVNVANKEVYDLSVADPSKGGMGTTLVLSLFTKAGVFIAHVGDSRAYLVRQKKVIQLTEDHSLVNEMIKAGVISKEKALNHPQGNVITKAVGIQEGVTPDVLFYEFTEGDSFFLSSDGLHEYLKDDDIISMLEKNKINTLAKDFIDFANERGGKDNITCICIQYGNAGAPPAHPSQITVTTKVETLKKIPLFSSLNFKEMAQVLEITQVRNIKGDTEVMKEGTTGEDMYIILKGNVGIYVGGKLVNELRPGQYFGEMSLIDKSPRSATVKTIAGCKMMRLTRSDLFPLLKRESRIGLKVFWAFLQNMNKRLRVNDRLISEIHQVEERHEESGIFGLSSLDK
jgi:serine/threonine protein phosphatase PrpC/CRP-like cAMP-binding protein